MGNVQVKQEILMDEISFVACIQEFSLSLLDYIEEQGSIQTSKELKQFFNAPGVFDGFVNVLV